MTEDIDVDALMSEIESPSAETTAEAAAPAAPEPPAWDPSPWEFDWNGKKVAPDSQDKARAWMSQGYNYSQRMGELNKTHAQRMAEADQRTKAAADLEQRYSPYTKVDEYAKKNPQWWEKVQADWQQAQQQQQGIDPNLSQALKPLEERLNKYEEHFGRIEQEKALADEKTHDTALDTEIGEIRKQFPNIDLTARDPESGEPLELRILKHAQSIGTTSFKAAFRDYLHDKLIEQAKASGLEAKAKEAEVNAKKGILGKTPAPVKAGPSSTYSKSKSYDQLSREALAEYGIT